MTEYTTSSEAIREFLTARERTARWIQQHYGYEDELLSPSAPPSSISDSDAPSYGPSDSEESSSSVPPRMILRWNDGRPDMPIDRSSAYGRPRTQSHPHPYSRRDESPGRLPRHSNFHPGAGSHHPSAPSTHSRHAQTLSYASVPPQGPFVESDDTPPPTPEHIVVLPSPQGEDVPRMPGTTPSHGSQSRHGSQHPSRTHSMHHPKPMPASGAYSAAPSHAPTLHAPSPRRAYNPSNTSHASRHATRSPVMQHSQSQPLPVAHGGAYPARPGTALPYAYSPPQIVYAPSSRHGGSHYAPPQIVYSPPAHPHARAPTGPGAPSITYSQSAPLPHPHHGRSTAPPGPRAVESSRSSHGHGRGRSFHRADDSRRGRSPDSDTSGSTYYVLPTPGQKVQIIPPSGAPSVRTATTATKVSHSPHSPHDAKKPFFQRMFHIPKLASSSTGSTNSSGRKLRRRHTLQVGAHAHDEQ